MSFEWKFDHFDRDWERVSMILIPTALIMQASFLLVERKIKDLNIQAPSNKLKSDFEQ